MRLRRIPQAPVALLCVAAASAVTALASCGGESPSVVALEWRIERRPLGAGSAPSTGSVVGNPTGAPAEREGLSVFAALRDADGLEDLEALWIINDNEELLWRLDTSSWTRRTEGSEEWFGTTDLAMPDLRSVPAGAWRVVAADLAGRRSEQAFRVDDASSVPPAPRLAREGGAVVLESTWPENLLLGYDVTGSLVRAAAARPGRLDAPSVLGAADAARCPQLCAYGYDAALRRGAFSAKVAAR